MLKKYLDINYLRLSVRFRSIGPQTPIGTYQSAVRPSHLVYYLDEYTFRFNRRSCAFRGKLFYRLVQQALLIDPSSNDMLKGPAFAFLRKTDDLKTSNLEDEICYSKKI